MSDSFDLIVLGSGPAGGRCATQCAAAGLRVAVVESRGFGGACALRGCNPKKVYTNAAAVQDAARRNAGTLLATGDAPRIDWPQLLAFKREFTDPVPESSLQKFHEAGIETIEGAAAFVGPRTLHVDGRTLSAQHVLLAVGSTPAPLDVPGAEHVLTSDGFLELPDLPPRVVFVGGGYISFEFAHAAARAGRTVTVLDRGPRPLPSFDPTLVKQLCDRTRSVGVTISSDTALSAVERQADGTFRVVADGPHGTARFDADLVVHGAGRVPNLKDLNLEAAGVPFDKSGVSVDEALRSVGDPHVYAAGDCAATGRPSLTPVADREGTFVADRILHADSAAAFGPVPSVVFTTPALAAVGPTVEHADKQGLRHELREADLGERGSFRKVGEPCGGARFLIDPQTDLILAAHLLGPAAEEAINVFAAAMAAGMTATRLAALPLAYPTFVSEYVGVLKG